MLKKGIRLAALALTMALFICSWNGTFAAGEPVDGLYTVGVTSNSNMFRVVKCVLRVEDGRLSASLTLSGKGYGYLFVGSAEEAAAAPRDTWAPYTQDSEGRHAFVIDIPALDTDLAVAAYSIKYSKWYDRTLHFSSKTVSAYREIAPDGLYDCALSSDTALDGAPCLLSAAAGSMMVEARFDGNVRALRVNGEDVALADGEGRFALESLDVKVPFATQLGGEWREGWLRLDSAALTERAIVVEDGVYTVDAKTDSGLLRFSRCLLTVRDGKMTALLTVQSNQFDYLYQGLSKDAPGDEAGWIPASPGADGAYTYVLEIPSLDGGSPLATYSAKKKMWYDRTLSFDFETLAPVLR